MLQKLFDHFSGRLYPYFWKYRHLWSKGWPESYLSTEALSDPHRKLIFESVWQFGPFFKLLELGCGPGANLYLLNDEMPYYFYSGVDISRPAIEAAKKVLPVHTYLRCEDIRDLGWRDEETDLILTDATLIYLNEIDISAVCKQMMKTAAKGIICVERHDDSGSFQDGRHWVHNFKKLLPGCELRKLTWNDWPDDGWSTYGYIITWRK